MRDDRRDEEEAEPRRPLPRRPAVWAVSFALLALLAMLGFLFYVNWNPRLVVTVHNVDSASLRGVTARLGTGSTYPLGDVPPGGSARFVIEPVPETGLEIHYVNAQGGRKTFSSVTGTNPGEYGVLDIDLDAQGVVRVRDSRQR